MRTQRSACVAVAWLCLCAAAVQAAPFTPRQLAIVAAFLPLAFALRATGFYRVGVLRFGSLAVAALASWWFIERAFDLAPS